MMFQFHKALGCYDKAYELGKDDALLKRIYFLTVFAPELDVDEVTAFRMGEGFGLGMGDMSQTCGAITGAVACMGLLNSAGDLDAPNTTKRATMGLASTLTARFLTEHGSCICQVLKGRTGCPVVPCDTCIADCVGYVEEELKNRI